MYNHFITNACFPVNLTMVFNVNRASNAGDACCFVDPSSDRSRVLEKCRQFRSNVILCDKSTLETIGSSSNVIAECNLFDERCHLLQLNEVKDASIGRLVALDELDVMTSSRVFFFASTSGSCGETKTIGVTFKCFMPNVEQLT